MKTLLLRYLNSYKGLTRPAWMLALIMLINRSGAMVIPFLGVYMTQSLHFTIRETGTVLSCFGLGAVSGSWLGGWLSDKAGHFVIQLGCLLLCVPVFCILPELTQPAHLSAGVFILSLVTETFRPANTVSIASYSSPESITKAFSLNRMAMNLGFSIGPALGGFLAAFSYHLLFYGNAVATGLAGLVFYFFFRNRKGTQERKKRHDSEQNSHQNRSPWKDTHFLIFTLLCCFYAICFFQLLNTLPLFYRQQHHLSDWSIGLILAYSGFVVFSLEMPLVHLAGNRLSAAAAIVIGTLLCGASFSLLVFPGKLLLLYFSMFLLCLSEILAMPFMATVTLKRSSKDTQGAYMGMNALSFSAAHILSPFAGTRIVSSFGFDVLWISTGILAVITAAGFLWVMKKL
ncbi:MFS transporter [Pararcticibacter amylolyticus]|uniref:MFS transporter n=1 Tax=Pararcticibacter amylolyticus TaxID=2173175 RepID=A0A2U2PLE0_9SPHI|nr:MFS transporter [Pararcticibacter amylolyticus]PWG81989.1 MFS transporter [Pararcticibacter amylolyticus]